jgi:hypothetical protein
MMSRINQIVAQLWAIVKRMLARRVRVVELLVRLYAQGELLMSAVSDFAARQTTFNDRLTAAISGVAADVAALNAKIEELQNTPGSISDEDQVLLDELQTRGEALATALEAVDNLTPPPPPIG